MFKFQPLRKIDKAMTSIFYSMRSSLLGIRGLILEMTKKLPLTAFFIIDLFFLVFYVSTFYPGYLTADSLYMLNQALGNQDLTNWHPPLITKIWGSLHHIFQSAGGVWLIQIALFIAAAHVFSATLRSKIVGLACLIAILAWPPLFTNMGALWKDNWAVIFTLFCSGFTFRAIKFSSSLNVLIAVVFFVLASLTRIDYAAITLPIVLCALIFSSDKTRLRSVLMRTSLQALMLCLVILGATSLYVNTWVEKKLNPWVTIAIWDIAGIFNNSSVEIKLPGYNCATSDPIVFGAHRLFQINLPEGALINSQAEEKKRISDAWLKAIFNHPISYIEHRMCIAKVFFGFSKQVYYPYPSPIFISTPLTQIAERSALNRDLYWFFDSNAHGVMFRYFIYVSLCALFIGIALMLRSLEVVQCLLFSTVFMAASRVMVLPAADFRYGLWIVVGTILLAALFSDELVSKIRQKTFNTPTLSK